MKYNIKLISYRNKLFFIYDVNKNKMIEIDKEDFASFCDNSIVKERITPKIEELMKNGYITPIKNIIIEHPASEYLENYIDDCASKMILQVTHSCNFRCRYCSFSNNTGISREHESKSLSLEKGKKAILFLKEKSSCRKDLEIFFYGGEPLIEFYKIKEYIKYAHKIMPEKNIKFFMTTNLSILNDAIIDFFIENDINITVSLDGPKEVHDKYRRYAKDGSGTFNTTYNNLKKIFNKSKKYYLKNVSINAVVDPASDISLINDFFEKDELFADINVSFGLLDNRSTDMFYYQTSEFMEKYTVEYLNYLLISSLDSGKPKSYFRELDRITVLDENFEKTIDSKTNKWHHNGPCLPGYNNIFVNVSGDMYPCEKVNELNPKFVIGNVEEGYNYENIEKLLNIGRLTEKECKLCWAKHLCSLCQVSADNVNELSKERKLLMCQDQKKRLLQNLKAYAIIKKIKELRIDE